MSNIARFPFEFQQQDNIVVYDDFTRDIDSAEWVSTLTDSGTASVGDAVGGILALVASDGSVVDNDEAYIESPNEVFKLAAGKPIYAMAYVQFTEANTDDANVFFGLADAIGANTLVDDGAGLKTSFSGAAIYKVDGSTVWKCVTSNSTTQTISTSTTTAGGASYQKLEIDIQEFSSTACVVTFKVDGQRLLDSTTGLPIRHTILYASATEMQLGAGVKNGGSNLETLNIDYMGAVQVR